MTDKERGALAATMFCLAIIFGAVALLAAWNRAVPSIFLGVIFGTALAKAACLTWGNKP